MEESKSYPIIIFADGACSGNPGPGGWAAIVATPNGAVKELGGARDDTTNNQMELAAVGHALKYLKDTPGIIYVYTDSSYVILGITQWIHGWRRNGWKTKEGKEVSNTEFWKRLDALVSARRDPIEFKYVRGHAGIPGNERVDEIAVAYSKGQWIALYDGPLLQYSIAIYDIPENTDVPERKPKEEKKEAYCYLSAVGGIVARHKTWKECEARVKGVPGAKFKKCFSEEEAQALTKQWGG